ncbi:CYTH domain-containing protein [Alteribacillus iranensis]|uniref:Uncharacterized protein YjbK n=1 Tax=Alteribacillus iranensis TaxID=930128 RepID=A0A1I2D001_9BACI|nr:CYTH domain-containing protein [Alteribacillus iranensis]SFE73805.1 Uncharacterized protein YjbK [Alteribacillus iranensis]
MSQEKEIEIKNVLTLSEFVRLRDAFSLTGEDFHWQANTYFDTPRFDLRSNQSALRVRAKKGQYELTLKQPAEEGLLETNQSLTREEAERAISSGILPQGEVTHALSSFLSELTTLTSIGTLETRRASLPYQTGTLFLDHSVYLGTEDYEIELEGNRMKEVENWLEELMKQYGIPRRTTPNKIQRFFTRKQEIED